MNLARIIEDHPSDAVAVIDGEDTLTYGALRDAVDGLRAVLAADGVETGTPVGVAAGNEAQFAIVSLAVLGLGAIVMPLNPTSTAHEMAQKASAGHIALVVLGEETRVDEEAAETIGVPVVSAADLLARIDPAQEVPEIVDCADDDSAFYMATSGVTGSPKVAVLSHHNLGWVHEALLQEADPIGPDDVLLAALPFAHIFGLNVVLLAGLRAGSTLVMQRRFDADESLELMRRYGIRTLSGAPPMWRRWAMSGADDVLSRLDRAVSGAAALPLSVYEEFRDRYGVEITQGYGLTETAPLVTMGRGHDVRPASVGKVVDGVQVALVDPEGRPVDLGDQGEIVIRSPGVFQGYLDDPDTTHSVLTDDGWFWSGDVGIFDDDGYLYLVDRIKDLIIVSGFNVYPAEVEDVLLRHPDVTGAIVVGEADVNSGETVVAHVSGTRDEESLRAHVAQYLSRYKLPTRYEFVDELPMAPTGKAIRRAVR
ncbi:MAG: AMP-binding protein [Actinomycetota bacterium]